MRRAVLALAVVLVALPAFAACTPPPPTCRAPNLPTTVAYRSIPGVPANSVSLDIHAAEGICHAPVVMWVHGGGYQAGDKSNQVADKIKLFNAKGWTFISVNYRLTVAGDSTSAHFPDHFEDVAASVAWVHDNVAQWNGDPSRVALLGHSAGADIVSNVAVNPSYLGAKGLPLSALRCAAPLDTEGFDKASAQGPTQAQWAEALGNNPNYIAETSATKLVAPARGIPPTIGVFRGTATRQRIENAFLDAVGSVGASTARIDARSLSHSEVNTRIGAPGDTVMTAPLVSFLTSCLAPGPNPLG